MPLDHRASACRRGDCTLALHAAEPGQSAALRGRPYDRPQTHLMALRVEDLSAARAALLEARVPLVRADDSVLVLDPGATGGVQTAIVDRPVPGDPRAQYPPGRPGRTCRTRRHQCRDHLDLETVSHYAFRKRDP